MHVCIVHVNFLVFYTMFVFQQFKNFFFSLFEIKFLKGLGFFLFDNGL